MTADWVRSHLPELLFPLDAAVVDELFSLYRSHCVSTASGLTPDAAWVTRLDHYLEDPATPEDDKTHIRSGRERSPAYYEGGAILDHNPGAAAITLDDCVFVRPGKFDANTYVHEMVHVGQYGRLGVSGFLAEYFGTSAVTVVEHWAKGEPIDLMTSSHLENDAYAIGNRFDPEHRR